MRTGHPDSIMETNGKGETPAEAVSRRGAMPGRTTSGPSGLHYVCLDYGSYGPSG